MHNGPVGWVLGCGIAGSGCDGACQAALASSTVVKTGTTCQNLLIAKISLTIALRQATASRRSFGFNREAAINARKPALEIYSTDEKSTTMSSALEVTAATSRACTSPLVRLSIRPTGRKTRMFAWRLSPISTKPSPLIISQAAFSGVLQGETRITDHAAIGPSNSRIRLASPTGLGEPKYSENHVFCVNGVSDGHKSQRGFNRLRVKFVT
jgi:hypothetical protein